MQFPVWVDETVCVRLAVTLVHFLWQGAVIAAMAAAVARFCGRPRGRYGVYMVAIAVMVACVVGTFVYLGIERSAMPQAAIAAVEGEAVAVSRLVEGVVLPAASSWRWAAPWVVLASAVGVVLAAGRLTLAFRGVARLRRGGEPVTDPALLEVIARQARRLGLHLRPGLAWCASVAVPTVVGVVRPVILLPASFTTGLTPAQVEAVLIHELVHLRRWDHLANLLQCAVETLLFFHPAVWWVSSRARLEREQCCDDAVIAGGVEPVNYAASLVELAQRALAMNDAALTMRATGRPSQLRWRIGRLLGLPHEKFHPGRAWAVTMSLTVIAATMGLCACALNISILSSPSTPNSALRSQPPSPAVEATPATTPQSRIVDVNVPWRAGTWSPDEWSHAIASNASVHYDGSHPVFQVDNSNRLRVWTHYLRQPVDVTRFPVVVLTYLATGTADTNMYTLWLDDGRGPATGGGVTPFRSRDVVSDGRVRQLICDLRDLKPTGSITGLALGVHAAANQRAEFELIELRFEAASMLAEATTGGGD